MTEVVLTTLNARYLHSAFGLRYLLANLGDLRSRAEILEFQEADEPLLIAKKIADKAPRIIGIGVYIWNVESSIKLVRILRKLLPDVFIVVGGPEVSHEVEQQEITALADYVITGEADIEFKVLCEKLLNGSSLSARIFHAGVPDLASLTLPYDLYTQKDIDSRIIYVEASRGCPFTCEFCLSSLDIPVRQFNLSAILESMEKLLTRGVTQFKFVDRTFNLNLRTSRAILEFFLERYREGLFIHFEMIPDRLPEGLKDIIKKFPRAALQFEVGIQTFNPEVSKLISRRQDYLKIEENLKFLREETGVHVHADLIAGLPGEDLESFAAGFDRLRAIGPQEIQVGILKRLRGTPIIRHDQEWEMVYNPNPPYEVLKTKLLSVEQLLEMRNFSRFWDQFGNSGNFVHAIELLCREGSAFGKFLAFSNWIARKVGKNFGLSLARRCELLWEYLGEIEGLSESERSHAFLQDLSWRPAREWPGFLKGLQKDTADGRTLSTAASTLPKRQRAHLAQHPRSDEVIP